MADSRNYTTTYRITRSNLFNSGEEFSQSDMAGRLQATAYDVRIALRQLVTESKAIVCFRNGSYIYKKSKTMSEIMKMPLTKWTPPKSINEEHLNPWIVR